MDRDPLVRRLSLPRRFRCITGPVAWWMTDRLGVSGSAADDGTAANDPAVPGEARGEGDAPDDRFDVQELGFSRRIAKTARSGADCRGMFGFRSSRFARHLFLPNEATAPQIAAIRTETVEEHLSSAGRREGQCVRTGWIVSVG